MARARMLKPGFFLNDELAALKPHTRLLFAGLWLIADREGRLEDNAAKIRAQVFPYESVSVGPMLTALVTAGFIVKYEAGGRRYIAIANFSKHQNPHTREPGSTIPAPDEPEAEPGAEPGAGPVLGKVEAMPGRAESVTGVGVGNRNTETESERVTPPLPPSQARGERAPGRRRNQGVKDPVLLHRIDETMERAMRGSA